LFCTGVKLLTSRLEHKLRVFENRVLKRIYGCTRKEGRKEWEDGENCIMRSFVTSILSQILLG
jgi:hypothetical protein